MKVSNLFLETRRWWWQKLNCDSEDARRLVMALMLIE